MRDDGTVRSEDKRGRSGRRCVKKTGAEKKARVLIKRCKTREKRGGLKGEKGGSRKKLLLPGKSGFSAIYSTGVPNVYTPSHPSAVHAPVRVETTPCTHGQDRILSTEAHYSLLLFPFHHNIHLPLHLFFNAIHGGQISRMSKKGGTKEEDKITVSLTGTAFFCQDSRSEFTVIHGKADKCSFRDLVETWMLSVASDCNWTWKRGTEETGAEVEAEVGAKIVTFDLWSRSM